MRSDFGQRAPGRSLPATHHVEHRVEARLLVGVGHGFSLGLRGGYQARVSRSGGPTVGATVQLGF